MRLYLQSERYRDAGEELEQIIKDFPERKDLEEQIRQLRQLGARIGAEGNSARGRRPGSTSWPASCLTQFPIRRRGRRNAAGSSRATGQIRRRKTQRREALVDELDAARSPRSATTTAAGWPRSLPRKSPPTSTRTRSPGWPRSNGWPTTRRMTPEQKGGAGDQRLAGRAQPGDRQFSNGRLAGPGPRQSPRVSARAAGRQSRPRWRPSCTTLEGASVERVAQILKLMKPPLDVPKEAQRGPRLLRIDGARAGRTRPTAATSCSCRRSTIRCATIRRS